MLQNKRQSMDTPACRILKGIPEVPKLTKMRPIVVYPVNGGNGVTIEELGGRGLMELGLTNTRLVFTNIKDVQEYVGEHFDRMGKHSNTDNSTLKDESASGR